MTSRDTSLPPDEGAAQPGLEGLDLPAEDSAGPLRGVAEAPAPGRRKAAMVGGLWLAASQFVPFFGTALLSVVAGRLLGAERLGTQSLIAFAEALVSAVLVQTLTAASIRTVAAAHGEGDERKVALMSWWAVRAHLILGATAALLLAGFALLRHDGESSWWLASVSVLATASGWAYGCVVVGVKGWERVGQLRLLSQLAAAVMAIGALLMGGGIEWIFIANILASLWVAFAIRREARGMSYAPTRQPLPDFWRLYLMLALGEIIAQLVVRRSEFFILDKFSSESEIAMYSIAFMLVAVATSVPQSLGNAVMPEVARAAGAGDMEGLRHHLSRALRVTAFFSLPLAGAMVTVGPDLVSLVYGEQYRRAGELTAFASISVVLLPVWSLCQDYWSGRGLLKPVLVAGAIGAVVDLAAAFTLIPGQGALGAVLAKLCGQFVLCTILIAYTWWKHDRPAIFNDAWRTMAVITVIASGAGWAASHHLGTFMATMVAGVVYLLVLFAAMIVCRPLRHLDALWLGGVLPGPARALVMRMASRGGRHAAA